MHQRFLKDYLMKAAEVYLVSRFRDDRLKYPEANDFRIFIPDLHLIDKTREKDYNYGTNYLELLERVVKALLDFKRDASQDNVHVTVYQVGDFLDMWREIPVAFSVKEASRKLKNGVRKILEARRGITVPLRGAELKTQFLLGNHDFDLHYIPEFASSALSYYFPISAQGPSVFTLHGNVFDLFERNMPESLKNLGVYIFGPSAKPATEKLGEFREETMKVHQNSDYKAFIQQPRPANLSEVIAIQQDKPTVEDYIGGDNFNIKKVGDPACKEADLRFVTEAKEFAAMVNKEQGWDLRFAVIGHTHHARIALDETDGFFALIDCGAWIENCEGSGMVMSNAQLGVLYHNDARVYQLKPKNG
jgi:UDP-2,3-diacylglucosamine pyrophosphatase LpxH